MARSASMNGVRVANTTCLSVKSSSIGLFLAYTAMTNAKPSVAVNITSLTNASCTGPCYIANYGALAVHTFNPVQTITTATLIPYVTILSNGTNATSISTRSANITLSPNSSYVSASNPLTSVVSGFTFTYPSHAIEYNNIQGYVYTMTSVNNQSTCTLDEVDLPFLEASITFVAATSLPLTDAVDGSSPYIPPQVIDNLNKVPEVTAKLNTSNISSCINAFAPQMSLPKLRFDFEAFAAGDVKALTTTAVALATGEPVVVSAAAAAQVKSPAASTTLSQARLPSKDKNGLVEGGQAKLSQETSESSLGQSTNPSQGDITQVSPPLLAQISTTAQPKGTQIQGPGPLPKQVSNPALPETTQPQLSPEPSPASPGEQSIPANLEEAQDALHVSTHLRQSITAGSQVFALLPGPSSGYVMNGEDLAPGNAITANGIAISLPSSGSLLIAGTSTVNLNPAVPTITAGPQTAPIPSMSSSRYVINGQNLAPGGAVTMNGVLISWPVSGLVLIAEGSTVPLDSAVQTISAGSQAFVLTPGSHSGFMISGQSLASGNAVTVNGIAISLPTSGSVVIVASSTIGLGATEIITAGGQALTFLPDPSFGSTMGGQTIVPVSLLLSSSSFVLDGSTIQPGTTRLVTVASQIFALSAGSSSRLIINSQTLTPGQDITIDGIPISLFPSKPSVVIGTSTIPLGPSTEEIISIGSQALTVAKGTSSPLVVDGHTITPGKVEVIDGVTVSLPSSGTAVMVDTSSVGIAPLILSGLGFGPTSTSAPTATGNLSVVGFTGGVGSLKGGVNGWWIWMIGAFVSCWMASS